MTKFCLLVDIRDVITYATFGGDRLRGLGVALGRISHFPIDIRRRPNNTLTLPCECVIQYNLSISVKKRFFRGLLVSVSYTVPLFEHALC